MTPDELADVVESSLWTTLLRPERSEIAAMLRRLATAEAHMATCPLLMKEGPHQDCDTTDDRSEP